MLEGYQHSLLLIRYKHRRYQGGMLMANYTDMYTRSKKGIKVRMETTMGLYGKGYEIISWHSFYVGSCFVLSNNSWCMRCRHNMLHQICMSQISNDNIRQCSKTVFSDDNIRSSPCMVGEKVGNLSLYSSFTFNVMIATISQHIMGYSAFIPTWAM